MCVCSGPTFIKLGQWASTRPDIFPSWSDALSVLQSAAPGHGASHSLYILKKAFPSLQIFIWPSSDQPELNSRSPSLYLGKVIGSGCIAQVHDGWLLVYASQ